MEPSELLTQAFELATGASGSTDADLRRSASYYALFHAISDDAAAKLEAIAGSQLRSLIRRTITHVQIRRACEALIAWPKGPATSWCSSLHLPLQPELVEIATLFVELYEVRQAADYDSLARFREKEVLQLQVRAMAAHGHWLNVRHTPNAAVFLTAVLLGDKLGKRG